MHELRAFQNNYFYLEINKNFLFSLFPNSFKNQLIIRLIDWTILERKKISQKKLTVVYFKSREIEVCVWAAASLNFKISLNSILHFYFVLILQTILFSWKVWILNLFNFKEMIKLWKSIKVEVLTQNWKTVFSFEDETKQT